MLALLLAASLVPPERITTREQLSSWCEHESAFDRVLRRIGSGRKKDFELGRRLLPLSDGHCAEELSTALAATLDTRPRRMLSRIAAGEWQPTICGDFGEPTTLAGDARRISIRERSVRRVRDRALRAARKQCLEELQQARKDTRRFFQQPAKAG
jgi:hypothetical protein